MNIEEAKAECNRWLAYLEKQKEKSIIVQELAKDVRLGKISSDHAKKRLRDIDRGVTVYDGAKLAEAVKLLLKNCK